MSRRWVCWRQWPETPLSSLTLGFPFRLMKNMTSQCLSAMTCPQEWPWPRVLIFSQLS